MKLKFLLLAFTSSFSISVLAQDANKTFAITGNGGGDLQWMNIRQIDLSTGSVIKNIFENNKTKFVIGDNASANKHRTAKENLMQERILSIAGTDSAHSPLGSIVAAAAYDKKHNKLLFTPVFTNELRWLDLSSGTEVPQFYSHQSPLLANGDLKFEENHFTRMAIGADGNGYLLTNDGNHLIKFTTGKKIIITDLGALVNASSKGQISVYDRCTSWGGDIVADAFGNLYLFTASKSVFKINPATMLATYLGSITGLSGTYTVNGAAADSDDNVIISSASTFEGFYKVNIKDFTAVKLNTAGQIFDASDLANGNLLFEKQLRNTVGVAPLVQREGVANQLISIYPNPVTGSQIKITFNNKSTGNYTIALTDIQGKVIHTKQVLIKSVGQVAAIEMKSKPANGMYLIKVINANKKTVFSDKIIIE